MYLVTKHGASVVYTHSGVHPSSQDAEGGVLCGFEASLGYTVRGGK